MKHRILSALLALTLLFSFWSLPAAGAEQVIGYVVVTNENNVNVRTGPSTKYPVITSVAPDSRYECIGIAETGWYHIKLTDTKTGYITHKLTRLEENAGPQGSAYSVPVYYRTTDGTILHSYVQPLGIGQNTVSVNMGFVPSGHRLISSQNVQVSISSSGAPTPAAVLFLFVKEQEQQPIPQNPNPSVLATVKVVYKDVYGTVVLSDYEYLGQGLHTVNAKEALLPAGYRLIGAKSLLLYISPQLKATPSEVNFLVLGSSVPQQPQQGNVEVKYQTINGVFLNSERLSLAQGVNTVYANDSLVPSNYMLYSQRSTQVFVNQLGQANPSSVTFLYTQKPQNQSANVPVYYRNDKGEHLYSETVTLQPGTRSIKANDSKVPGYILVSNRKATIYVSNEGYASPASVVFVYKLAKEAIIKIVYEDTAANVLYSENRPIRQGTHSIKVNKKLVPAGYTLNSPSSIKVTVDANGVPSQNTVKFIFVPPITANVTVSYIDDNGNTVGTDTVSVKYGNNVIRPKNSFIPAGYKVSGNTSYNVTVDAGGVANPSAVSFSLVPKGPADSSGYTIPNHKKARLKGDYIVYTGPGTEYYRADGKARVINGVCRWYGYENGYVMMGYENSKGNYRIGYIDAAGTPAGLDLPNLNLLSESIALVSEARFTDDPIINVGTLFKIPAGTTVTFLGYLPNSDKWAYIETSHNGQPARGFINKKHLGK